MFQLIVEEGIMTVVIESLQFLFLDHHSGMDLQEIFKMHVFLKNLNKNALLTLVPFLVPALLDLPEDVRGQYIPE